MPHTTCGSNGTPVCVRGFTREKCSMCSLGSVACDMCQAGSRISNSRQGLPQQHSYHGRGNYQQKYSLSTSALVSSSSSIALASSPQGRGLQTGPAVRRSKSITLSNRLTDNPSLVNSAAPNPPVVTRTISISYQLPLPSAHPQRSLLTPTPTMPSPKRDISLSVVSLPAERTLTSASAPTSPTALTDDTLLPCIFCFHGRKTCDECFGLGYVQRICQECLRDQRRRSNSGRLGKASLPASLNQFGTKMKEQISHFASSSLLSGSTPSLARNDAPIVELSKKKKQQQWQFRSKSMVSLPNIDTFTSPLISPTLGPVPEAMEGEEESPLHNPANATCNEGNQTVTRDHIEITNHHGDNNGNAASVDTDNTRQIKRSLKMAIMSALKVPTVFQSKRNNKSINNEQAAARRRRQWPLRSLSMISLPSASTAA